MMKLSYACKNLAAETEEPLCEHEPYIPSTLVETSTSDQVPPVYTELQPSPHFLRTVPVSNFTAVISELDSNPCDFDQISQQAYSLSEPVFSFWVFQIRVLVF